MKHLSEQDYAGYIEKPIVNIMSFNQTSYEILPVGIQ